MSLPPRVTRLAAAIAAAAVILAAGWAAFRFYGPGSAPGGRAGDGLFPYADLFDPADPADPRLPEGATVLTGATMNDVYGDWAGTFTFTALSGLEAVGATAEQAKSTVEEALASPKSFEISYRDGGKWRLNIDFMNGMDLDSNVPEEDDPQQFLILTVTGGRFAVNAKTGGPDASESLAFRMDGVVFEDEHGRGIVGSLSVAMSAKAGTVVEEGTFLVRPE